MEVEDRSGLHSPMHLNLTLGLSVSFMWDTGHWESRCNLQAKWLSLSSGRATVKAWSLKLYRLGGIKAGPPPHWNAPCGNTIQQAFNKAPSHWRTIYLLHNCDSEEGGEYEHFLPLIHGDGFFSGVKSPLSIFLCNGSAKRTESEVWWFVMLTISPF